MKVKNIKTERTTEDRRSHLIAKDDEQIIIYTVTFEDDRVVIIERYWSSSETVRNGLTVVSNKSQRFFAFYQDLSKEARWETMPNPSVSFTKFSAEDWPYLKGIADDLHIDIPFDMLKISDIKAINNADSNFFIGISKTLDERVSYYEECDKFCYDAFLDGFVDEKKSLEMQSYYSKLARKIDFVSGDMIDAAERPDDLTDNQLLNITYGIASRGSGYTPAPISVSIPEIKGWKEWERSILSL